MIAYRSKANIYRTLRIAIPEEQNRSVHLEGLVILIQKSQILFEVVFEDFEVVCRLATTRIPLEARRETSSLLLRQIVMPEVRRDTGVVVRHLVQPRVEALTTVKVF